MAAGADQRPTRTPRKRLYSMGKRVGSVVGVFSLAVTLIAVFHSLFPFVGGLLLAIVLYSPSVRAIRDLGEAFLPSLLPLATLAIVLVHPAPIFVQILVGAVYGWLVFAFLLRSIYPELKQSRWRVVGIAFGVVLIGTWFTLLAGVIMLAIIGGLFNVDLSRDVGRLGGIATLFAGVAILALLLSLFLRVAEFATSALRRILAVALLLGFVWIAVVAAGPAAVGMWLRNALIEWSLTLTILVSAAAVIVAESFAADSPSGEIQPELGRRSRWRVVRAIRRRLAEVANAVGVASTPTWTSRKSRAGASAAALSAMLVLGSLVAATAEVAVEPTDPSESHALQPFRNAPFVFSDKDIAFARDFRPALAFTDDERWIPQGAMTFLRNRVVLEKPNGQRRLLNDATLPSTCPGAVDVPCFVLRLDPTCTSGDHECARGKKEPWEQAWPLVYARVLRSNKPAMDGSPDPFRHPSPYGKNLRYLIQYWLFYHYDEWKRVTPIGVLEQRHEGDWEAVTIGFGAKRPLFVAFSAHCGGRWFPWERVEVARWNVDEDKPVIREANVFVGVAEGSHANYRDLGARAPDWAGCRQVTGFASILSFIGNIREATGRKGFRLPRILLTDASRWPMNFPGFWGGFGEIRLVTGMRARTLNAEPELGPATPTFQPLWQSPLKTIFCSDAWTPRRCAS